MMNISASKRVAAAALAAILLVAVGCGDDDDDGGGASGRADAAEALGPEAPASGEPVKVGLISDGSSAVTDNGIVVDVGEATAQWLKEHRSGIGGRPIELVTCVAETDPGPLRDRLSEIRFVRCCERILRAHGS